MLIGQPIGPFEIEKELGSGAMGTVYRAKFHKDGKAGPAVALKVDRPRPARATRGRWPGSSARPTSSSSSGTRTSSACSPPASYKETPFIAMEYVDGESLDRVLGRRGRLGWEEVVELRQAALRGPPARPRQGDHPPRPEAVEPDDHPDGMLKLTDFGIAKDTDVTALTGANSTIGTAAYMSPEQCKGERNLTGKSRPVLARRRLLRAAHRAKPFVAETTVDMFLKHVNEKPFARPAKLVPDIPVWLDTLVCQMMEKKPEHRPLDAAMVGQVLEEIEEKVAAQHERRGGRGQRPRRPDRAAARRTRPTRTPPGPLRAGARRRSCEEGGADLPAEAGSWRSACAGRSSAGIGVVASVRPRCGRRRPESLDAGRGGRGRRRRSGRRPTEYLKHYGDRDDDATEKVAGAGPASCKVARARAESCSNRYGTQAAGQPEEDDDPEAYDATMAALTAENDGDLAAAGRGPTWTELADASTPTRPTTRPRPLWGWLAQKKLADLDGRRAATLAAARSDRRTSPRWTTRTPRFDDDRRARSVAALRLEQFGDFDRAARPVGRSSPRR